MVATRPGNKETWYVTAGLRWVPAVAAGALFLVLGFGAAIEAGAGASSTALAQRGAELMQASACKSCHTYGPEREGRIGPGLDMVIMRRSPEWLHRWLDEPAAIKPGTLMPAFGLDREQREAIIAYLETLAEPVDVQAILADGPTAEAGRQLVEAYQCFACHKVAGQPGRVLYPDLTTVAERRTVEWERNWLADPQAVIPDTFMPNFRFSDDEIKAITAFLYE